MLRPEEQAWYAEAEKRGVLSPEESAWWSEAKARGLAGSGEPKPAPKNLGAIGNVLMGGLKGASDIGATLLTPLDAILNKTGLSSLTNKQRRAELAKFFEQSADPGSLAFKGGALGSQIAGTAGVGGVLGKGAVALGKAIPAASPFATKAGTALASGGFKIGAPATTVSGKLANAGIRTGAGATVGGVQAGMINPDDAGTGAVVGGVLPGAYKGAVEIGKGLRGAGSQFLGATTGTGADSVRTAYQSGKEGASEFLTNMRGEAPFDEIVGRAKSALNNMRMDRSKAYRSGMIDITADKSVIDFQPITEAVKKISQMGEFKGQKINKNASGVVSEIVDTVGKWSGLDPSDFHTPEGLDALKQAIGDIRDTTQFGTAARRAADTAYNAVKNQITAQAPTYSRVMGDYSKASATITEIEKSLSLGDKATKDTAIRKLQSLMRNNVQTNYGNRTNLMRELEEKGGARLMPAIAGQSMNSVMPRGIFGAMQKAGAIGTGFIAPSTIPALLAAAPLTSPRAVGEAMYGLGRGAGMMQDVGRQQLGRLGLLDPKMLEAYQAFLRSAPPVAIATDQQ